MKLISENLQPKLENGAPINSSDAISDVGVQLQEFNLLFTERAILRMHAKELCQTSVKLDFPSLTEETPTTCNPEVPVTVRENVGIRNLLRPISMLHSGKTVGSKDDEEATGTCVQFIGNRGYFDKHYLSVTVPTPLILTARSIMVEELAVAGIKMSAIYRY